MMIQCTSSLATQVHTLLRLKKLKCLSISYLVNWNPNHLNFEDGDGRYGVRDSNPTNTNFTHLEFTWASSDVVYTVV